MTTTIESLRDMAKHARDSARLHCLHGGEQPEVDRWTRLACLWEARALVIETMKRASTQNVLSGGPLLHARGFLDTSDA